MTSATAQKSIATCRPTLTQPLIAHNSKRLTLSPFTAGDAVETFEAITPDLARFTSWEAPRSQESFVEVWTAWLQAMATGSDMHFVIRLKENREFIGVAGLHDIGSERPELGIWIKEAAQGRGYGVEAISALMVWALKQHDVAAFMWPVAVANSRSRKLAEKLAGNPLDSYAQTEQACMTYEIPAPKAAGEPG